MALQLWSAIEHVSVDSLSDEQFDQLFELLKNAKMEDDFDIVKIKKLFDVTQAVMINRNQLLEDAMNEAEVEAKKSLKRDVKSDLCTGNIGLKLKKKKRS